MPSPEGSGNLKITLPGSLNWGLRNQVPLKRPGLFTTSQGEIWRKTRSFSITVVRRDEFSAYPYMLSILILSLHLRLDLRSDLSPGFFQFVLQLSIDFNISDITVPNDSANTDAVNLHESPKAQRLLYVLQGFYCSWLDSSTGPRPLYRLGLEVTLRYTAIGRTPLDEWYAPRRDLYLTTHTLLKTYTHVPGGNRTRKPSKRAAADSRFRPRGHWYCLKTG